MGQKAAYLARHLPQEQWPGIPWGKSGMQLDRLVNPEDIARLVVFDTWTLNCDRHHPDLTVRKPNYDNVFLSSEGIEPGKTRLIAMDHGLCFIRSGEDLTPKLANIDKVKDDRIYGLFPEFRARLREDIIDYCTSRLREMDMAIADTMIATVPREWDVSKETCKAWSNLILQPSGFYILPDNVLTLGSIKHAPWFGATGE